MKTPDTPYGAFLGANPSPTSRKYWKWQCEQLKRYQVSVGSLYPEAGKFGSTKILKTQVIRNVFFLSQTLNYAKLNLDLVF